MANRTYDPQRISYYMHNEIPWEPLTDRSRIKLLHLSDSLYMAIVQWDAGYILDRWDGHDGEETVYVLDGTFADGGPLCGPGSVIRGHSGGGHQPGTTDGVTFLVVRSLVPGEREKIARYAPGGTENLPRRSKL